MRFLIRPKPFNGEAFESYFLRLAHANGYFSYRDFITIAVKKTQICSDKDTSTLSISRLPAVNFYLEKSPNISRVEVFGTLAQLAGIDFQQLSVLSFHKNKILFSNGYKAVAYQGMPIPRCFVRKENIPICVECLKESEYIRQLWHLVPYQSCHIHKKYLLTNCPLCSQYLDYRMSESMTHCVCGYDLLTYKTDSAQQASSPIFVVNNIDEQNPRLLSQCDITEKLAFLLWYFQRFDNAPTVNLARLSTDYLMAAEIYCKEWPQSLVRELDEKVSIAEYLMIDVPSKIPLNKIFGSLISHAKILRGGQHSFEPVISVVREFLFKLIDENPFTRSSNIADLLVSINDITTLFSVNHKDVYRALDKGLIKSPIRLKSQAKIEVYQPLFPLRIIRSLQF